MARKTEKRPDAFVELFSQHQRQLLGYLHALVQNTADAEDLLQQTSLILWRKFDEFQPDTNFFAWACRIAYYEANNFVQSKRRQQTVFSQSLLAALSAERAAQVDLFAARREALPFCLEKLSPADRQLLEQCYERNTSIKQVAAHRGRSADGVYQSLRRIRQSLYDCINRALAQERSR